MAVDAYFEDIHKVILDNLNNAHSEIYIAVAWLKDSDFINTLIKQAKKGIKIEIILANHEFNKNSDHANKLMKQLIANNVEVFYIGEDDADKTSRLMHHKFCIIDNQIVINGSYNWTYKARFNDENIVMIKNEPLVVQKFLTVFNQIRPHYQLKIENDNIIKIDIAAIVAKFSQIKAPPQSVSKPVISGGSMVDIAAISRKFKF